MAADYGMMSLRTLEIVIQKALREAKDACVFGFQGGEPLLAGLGFFRAAADYVKRYNVNGAMVSFSVQTNGVLLDDAWADFFAETDTLVGVSIDAIRPVHDKYRVDGRGEGTHKKCLSAVRLLEGHGVQYNVLSVVTQDMAQDPGRIYRFFRLHNIGYIQFIPCLDGLTSTPGDAEFSLSAQSYGEFLCQIFDLWYDDLTHGRYISIRDFDNYINILAGKPGENCALSGACSAYPLIEADGSVYPCDFYAVDEYRLGSVLDSGVAELLRGETAFRFETESREIHENCRLCDYLHICRGGCRRNRQAADGKLILNRFCISYKHFFEHGLSRMKRLAESIR